MKFIATAITAVLLASGTALAQAPGHESHQAATGTGATDAALTQGEVRKIDKDAGKITLKHGPITNLQMPAMTMVFRAKDPSALDQVQVGDNVLFKVERIDGALTVTELKKSS